MRELRPARLDENAMCAAEREISFEHFRDRDGAAEEKGHFLRFLPPDGVAVGSGDIDAVLVQVDQPGVEAAMANLL